MSERAIVLLESNHGAARIVPLKVSHIADIRSAKRADRLIVIPYSTHARATSSQKRQPFAL